MLPRFVIASSFSKCNRIITQKQAASSRILRKFPIAWTSRTSLSGYKHIHTDPSSHQLHHHLPYLSISSEVKEALLKGKPIVALESTIISHGMPYPANLKTAREVEGIVRANGAIPATVAIIGGKLCVGLTSKQLEHLAKEGTKATKCSRRDIPLVLSTGKTGSTTVAGTMYIAAMAGVRVFVTGGIGGVHRGAESTMDISADLLELGHTPGMVVVCAGVKSILDIEKTLEVLETQGVPVLCYGTHRFPAFFTPDSGLPAPTRVDQPEEIATILYASTACDLPSSLLVAVPNPSPAAASAVQAAIDDAVIDASVQGLRGKEVTPFILQRVNEVTKGESLRANIELVKNNAQVGSKIAIAVAKKLQSSPPPPPSSSLPLSPSSSSSSQAEPSAASPLPSSPCQATAPTATGAITSSPSPVPETVSSTPSEQNDGHVVVIGGAVMDMIGSPANNLALVQGTSTPGFVIQKEGGVGRNIAEGLARLGIPITFITAIGKDPAGLALMASLQSIGPHLKLSTIQETSSGTASCLVILDEKKDLVAAIADMEIFKDITPDQVRIPELQRARLVVCDGNIPVASFKALAEECARHGVPLFFEPTSVNKSYLPLLADALHRVTFAKPNLKELCQMSRYIEGLAAGGGGGGGEGKGSEKDQQGDSLGAAAAAAADLEQELARIMGKDKVPSLEQSKHINHLLTPPIQNVLTAMATTTITTATNEGEKGEGGNNIVWWEGQKHLLVTLGSLGVLWGRISRPATTSPSSSSTVDSQCHVQIDFFPVDKPAAMVDCTGAGDTLVAGLIAGLMRPSPSSSPLLPSPEAEATLAFEGAVRVGMATAAKGNRSSDLGHKDGPARVGMAAGAAGRPPLGLGFEGAVRVGMAAARRSVQVKEAIPRDLEWEMLLQDLRHEGPGRR